MNVKQVIELAKEWVEIYGSQTPGFCGAHLMGSINHMPPDTPFPAYKDVDLSQELTTTHLSLPLLIGRLQLNSPQLNLRHFLGWWHHTV